MGGIEIMPWKQPPATQQEPILTDKLAGSRERRPKNASMGPWKSEDGTIFPMGKPKGKAKMTKVFTPTWELPDVENAMRKMGYDSMGPYFRECERRFRHISKIQTAAAIRIKSEMAAFGLTWKDLEGV